MAILDGAILDTHRIQNLCINSVKNETENETENEAERSRTKQDTHSKQTLYCILKQYYDVP